MAKIWIWSVLVVFLMAQSAFAEANERNAQPFYLEVGNVQADITIAGATAKVSGSAYGKSSDNTTRLTVSLQKRPLDGSGWSTMASWTDTASGRKRVYISKSCSVTKGYSYRVKAVAKIVSKEGAILETATKYSGTVTY